MIPPRRYYQTPAGVQFEDIAEGLGKTTTNSWHRTWLKAGATQLAESISTDDPADGGGVAAGAGACDFDEF